MTIKLGLSVDWDFFLSDPPSDAHDCLAFDVAAWSLRDTPQKLDPAAAGFWKEPFRLPRAGLVARSHVDALPYFVGCDIILNCDAHSDAYGIPREHPHQFTCANWTLGVPAVVIHCPAPRYLSDAYKLVRDETGQRRLDVDRLFICRSDPWSHPCHDQSFSRFLQSCPADLYVTGMADRPREIQPADAIDLLKGDWSELLKRTVTFYKIL